jgi:hypothetical protein
MLTVCGSQSVFLSVQPSMLHGAQPLSPRARCEYWQACTAGFCIRCQATMSVCHLRVQHYLVLKCARCFAVEHLHVNVCQIQT